MIFPDNTRKIIFQRDFFRKTIFSGRLEKENMVFRALFKILFSYDSPYIDSGDTYNLICASSIIFNKLFSSIVT